MTSTPNPPGMTSPTYHGPPCAHRDSTFTAICHSPTPQAQKLASLRALLTSGGSGAATLHYDPQANTAEDYAGFCTTFETAVACGEHAIVALLLDAGANPNICAPGEMPPLHRAIRNLDGRMVYVLADSGVADMNIRHERVSAQNLARRMGVPEEIVEEGEREEWERRWATTKRYVDYFVGRM